MSAFQVNLSRLTSAKSNKKRTKPTHSLAELRACIILTKKERPKNQLISRKRVDAVTNGRDEPKPIHAKPTATTKDAPIFGDTSTILRKRTNPTGKRRTAIVLNGSANANAVPRLSS